MVVIVINVRQNYLNLLFIVVWLSQLCKQFSLHYFILLLSHYIKACWLLGTLHWKIYFLIVLSILIKDEFVYTKNVSYLYIHHLFLRYATVYTMAPVFSLVLDQDVSEEIALLYPELYKELTKVKEERSSYWLLSHLHIPVLFLFCRAALYRSEHSLHGSWLVYIKVAL